MSYDPEFLRFDEGCMRAVDEAGREAASVLRQRIREAVPDVLIQWTPGDLVVIDNWKALHARLGSVPDASARMLYRVQVYPRSTGGLANGRL